MPFAGGGVLLYGPPAGNLISNYASSIHARPPLLEIPFALRVLRTNAVCYKGPLGPPLNEYRELILKYLFRLDLLNQLPHNLQCRGFRSYQFRHRIRLAPSVPGLGMSRKLVGVGWDWVEPVVLGQYHNENVE